MELKQQCSELVQAKSIHMSLLVGKPSQATLLKSNQNERIANKQNRNPNTQQLDKKQRKL